MTKTLIFDAGTLINLSMNGLLYLLERLKKTCNCKFVITREVKYEIVDRPIGIHRFELGALRIQSLLDSKVIEMAAALDVPDEIIKKRTKSLMEIANHSVQVGGKWIRIVSEGEMSCLALSQELSEKGIVLKQSVLSRVMQSLWPTIDSKMLAL